MNSPLSPLEKEIHLRNRKRRSLARVWLETRLVQVVNEYYSNWRRAVDDGLASTEPQLTVGMLWGHLNISHQHESYHDLSKADQRLQVWSVLESLRRRRALGSSMGSGLNGREARCYEPGSRAL